MNDSNSKYEMNEMTSVNTGASTETTTHGLRIFHTSDWHLGRSLYGQSLIEDQAFALEKLLELIDERKPHALLIAGDLFDRTLPPEDAVRLFNWFLREAAQKRELPLFLIPGNHDSRERVGYAASLLRDQRVTIFSQLEDVTKPVLLNGDFDQKVWIYGIPFVEPMEVGVFLGEDGIATPDAATRALCEHVLKTAGDEKPKILLCHAFVAGGDVSESEKEIFIGGSSQVSADAFNGFAYTALGHLHKPQSAGCETIRYSGSLLPYSKSEIGTAKTITEIKIANDGAVQIDTHPVSIRRELRYIEGILDDILQDAREDSRKDDYILVGFTDDGAVLDAFARLRQVYPNVLHVTRAGGFQPSSLPALQREREAMTDFELFGEFFRETTGSELSESERNALIDAINEASKEDAV